jgi:SAM-dependent methyltransferase
MTEQHAAAGKPPRCHICTAAAIEPVPGYERFHRVTSDCQPWPANGMLYACRACGGVQKAVDPAWQAETKQIYDAYAIYYQADGAEQMTFDQNTGQARSRSARVLEYLKAQKRLPETGRLLDVGCGNGALLRTFNRLAPLWSLAGTEMHDKHRSTVEQLNQVEALFLCEPSQVPGTFDLITMVHLLEHIPDPGDFLAKTGYKLNPDGLLVIEVPDYQQNPFDLLIADHCTHFAADTAVALIERAGFEIVSATTQWIPKELTILARFGQRQPRTSPRPFSTSPLSSVQGSLQWLEAVVETARTVAAGRPLGIFGTSIAATWLFSELADAIGFFVDEDPDRTGKSFLGRPVYSPAEAPNHSHIYIALTTNLAEAIKNRLARPEVTYHVPPALHP